MGGIQRRGAVRWLVACGMVATTLAPAAPASATTVCRGHSQPGITVTVFGIPVRIPAINVNVCVDTATPTSLVPVVDVVTGPQAGSPCQTSCLAVIVRTFPDRANTTVTVTALVDGVGVSNQPVNLPVPGPPGGLCVIGMGFPDPPIANCLVVVDPDDV
jgi:hypothetical protein